MTTLAPQQSPDGTGEGETPRRVIYEAGSRWAGTTGEDLQFLQVGGQKEPINCSGLTSFLAPSLPQQTLAAMANRKVSK